MNTSLVFHLPTCITVSGIMPLATARVAPVGLNDLALNPLPANPARRITSSNIFDTVLLEMALYGADNVINRGFVSKGRNVAVLLMYSRKHETGSMMMSSVFGGMFTSKPVRDVSFFMPKKCMVRELSGKNWTLSKDNTMLCIDRSLELKLIPLGAKSDGLVIHTRAIKVTLFIRSCFIDISSFLPHV